MKMIKKQAAQGEVIFTVVPEIPANAKLVTDKSRFADGYPIVSHSESGHHHVVKGEGVQFFETSDPLVCFLRISSDSVITNLREDQPHESFGFSPGNYLVTKSREYVSPEEVRAVAD